MKYIWVFYSPPKQNLETNEILALTSVYKERFPKVGKLLEIQEKILIFRIFFIVLYAYIYIFFSFLFARPLSKWKND